VPEAFVLVATEVGKEVYILNELRKLDFVKRAELVYGVYDLIVHVADNNLQALKQQILRCIRQKPYVRSTVTLIVAEGSLRQ